MEWTEKEIRWLTNNYKKKTIEECCKKLGRSDAAIRQYAYKHNIKKQRYYSKRKKEYIENHIGILSYDEMAKACGTSYMSIKQYVSRNGILPRDSAGSRITISELSRVLNRDRKTIEKTWVKRGLVLYKVGKYKMIDIDNLCEVMETNPDIWKAYEVDDCYFRSYKWFKNKKFNDRQEMINERWGEWYGKEKTSALD